MKSKRSDEYIVQSLSKGLKILGIFNYSRTELSVQEISKLTGINRTSVHRSVYTLEKEGFLERNLSNGKYSLGLKLFELGNMVAENMDLRQRAKVYLQELKDTCNVTAHLVVLDNWEAVYIDKVEPSHNLIKFSAVGKRVPLNCTAVGKVLLSGFTDEEILASITSEQIKKMTPNSIDNMDDLLKEVRKVRTQGYALDLEELELGLSCVAAPIFNYNNEVVGAVSASSYISKIKAERLLDLSEKVIETARKISLSLGWSG